MALLIPCLKLLYLLSQARLYPLPAGFANWHFLIQSTISKVIVVFIHILFWKVHLLDLTVARGTCVVQGVKGYAIFFSSVNLPIFFVFFNEKTSYFPIICFAHILLDI